MFKPFVCIYIPLIPLVFLRFYSIKLQVLPILHALHKYDPSKKIETCVFLIREYGHVNVQTKQGLKFQYLRYRLHPSHQS